MLNYQRLEETVSIENPSILKEELQRLMNEEDFPLEVREHITYIYFINNLRILHNKN